MFPELTGPNTELLKITLAAAVPIWILELKRNSNPDELLVRAKRCGQYIAEKGDVLQFGGKKGQAAQAFNALAEGLACLAFAPGGVTFCGLHFEATFTFDPKEP